MDSQASTAAPLDKMTEPSMGDGDAAFLSNNSDYLLWSALRNKADHYIFAVISNFLLFFLA